MNFIEKNELKGKFEEFLQTWSAYRDTNEKKIENLESKLVSASNESEIRKLNAMLEEQSRQLERLKIASNRPEKKSNSSSDELEKKALENYLRGYKNKSKFSSRSDDDDGSFQVHSNKYGAAFFSNAMGRQIITEMQELSVFRKICVVENTNSPEVDVIVDTGNFSNLSANWSFEAKEQGAFNKSNAFEINNHVIKTYENYICPMVTSKFRQDFPGNIFDWLGRKAVNAFAKEENRCFLYGNGLNQPKGIMNLDYVDYPERVQGSITRLYTEEEDGEITVEALLSLIYSIESHYSDECSFMMHPRMMEKIRSLKYIGSDNYIWQPALSIDSQETVLGIPVYFNYSMPLPQGSTDYPIMFGNFRRSCMIIDRITIELLEDPFSYRPLIAFYITKRVGFSVVDSLPLFIMKLGKSIS